MNDPRISSKPDVNVILASPVIVNTSTKPQRIVMCRIDEQYVVYTEFLKKDLGDGLFVHDSFYNGLYFSFKTAKRPGCRISEIEARSNAQRAFVSKQRNLLMFISI